MTGSVIRETQTLPITTPVTQGAGTVSGSSTPLDGTHPVPFVLVLDENNPARQVSPAGDDTLQAVLAALQALSIVSTAVLTPVPAEITSTQLLPANSARKGLFVVNDSTAIMYLAYASTASTTAYTVYLPGSNSGVPAYWEMPRPIYSGIVSAIWSSAVGSARVTELS